MRVEQVRWYGRPFRSQDPRYARRQKSAGGQGSDRLVLLDTDESGCKVRVPSRSSQKFVPRRQHRCRPSASQGACPPIGYRTNHSGMMSSPTASTGASRHPRRLALIGSGMIGLVALLWLAAATLVAYRLKYPGFLEDGRTDVYGPAVPANIESLPPDPRKAFGADFE